jgi:hypothetical protein
MSRYRKYRTKTTDSSFYSKQLNRRDIKSLEHYELKSFGSISDEDKRRLRITTTFWSAGTSLTKLADQYYGDQNLWWIIGFYNNKPIDANWQMGDKVLIPTPLQTILQILGRL